MATHYFHYKADAVAFAKREVKHLKSIGFTCYVNTQKLKTRDKGSLGQWRVTINDIRGKYTGPKMKRGY